MALPLEHADALDDDRNIRAVHGMPECRRQGGLQCGGWDRAGAIDHDFRSTKPEETFMSAGAGAGDAAVPDLLAGDGGVWSSAGAQDIWRLADLRPCVRRDEKNNER